MKKLFTIIALVVTSFTVSAQSSLMDLDKSIKTITKNSLADLFKGYEIEYHNSNTLTLMRGNADLVYADNVTITFDSNDKVANMRLYSSDGSLEKKLNEERFYKRRITNKGVIYELFFGENTAMTAITSPNPTVRSKIVVVYL